MIIMKQMLHKLALLGRKIHKLILRLSHRVVDYIEGVF